MKLYSIFLLYKEPEKQVKILKSAQDLNNFGYFQRSRYIYIYIESKVFV